MSDFAQLAGGALSFDVDKKKYFLPNLGMKQWAEFCQWVAFIPYRIAKREAAPEDILRETWKECTKQSFSPSSIEVLRHLATTDGFFKAFELSLRRGNPGITDEEIDKLITFDEDKYLD